MRKLRRRCLLVGVLFGILGLSGGSVGCEGSLIDADCRLPGTSCTLDSHNCCGVCVHEGDPNPNVGVCALTAT
jgi:hypothetical protein